MGFPSRRAERLGCIEQTRIDRLHRANQRQRCDRYDRVNQTRSHDDIDIFAAVGRKAKCQEEGAEDADRPEGQFDRIGLDQDAGENKRNQKAESERPHPRGNAPYDEVGQRECHELADDRGSSTDPESRQQDARKRLVCQLIVVLNCRRGIFNGTDAPRRKLLQAFDCQID